MRAAVAEAAIVLIQPSSSQRGIESAVDMSTQATVPTITLVPHQELSFDANNPRLGAENMSQDEILERLWRNFAVDEIAMSVAANGFFGYEPIFVINEGGMKVVVEGNRRLAAVRLLTDANARTKLKATDLPKPSSAALATLDALPVIVTTREDIWRFIGFKHVNGPQAWDAVAKAEYIVWVHNQLSVPLAEVAVQIGDKHATVARLYNARMALDQVEAAGTWSRDDRWNKRFYFSHLYTGLGYKGIQAFLGIDATKGATSDAPVPKTKIDELGELCVWLFGSKSRNEKPLIRSQNPDLRTLDDVLQNTNGIAALRQGLGLTVSLDIARGDQQILREKLVASKSTLQDARGKVLTGYQGLRDLHQVADEVAALAEELVGDMDRLDKRERRRKLEDTEE